MKAELLNTDQLMLTILAVGDRHLHLPLAVCLRYPGAPLPAKALHHSPSATQEQSKLLHHGQQGRALPHRARRD